MATNHNRHFCFKILYHLNGNFPIVCNKKKIHPENQHLFIYIYIYQTYTTLNKLTTNYSFLFKKHTNITLNIPQTSGFRFIFWRESSNSASICCFSKAKEAIYSWCGWGVREREGFCGHLYGSYIHHPNPPRRLRVCTCMKHKSWMMSFLLGPPGLLAVAMLVFGGV